MVGLMRVKEAVAADLSEFNEWRSWDPSRMAAYVSARAAAVLESGSVDMAGGRLRYTTHKDRCATWGRKWGR